MTFGAEKLVVEGTRGIHVATPAMVVDESKEVAWAGAHVVPRGDFGWIVGRFVEADNANQNGHIFGLDELKDAYTTILSTPLNMLHRAHHVVGTFTAAELIDPMTAEERLAADLGADILNPYVEALSAFWRYAFPDEWRYVKAAYDSGAAWYSMESVPSHVKCETEGGCGRTFEFKGSVHESYCAHLQQPRAPKRLIDPHFVGGAIIIPPTRPGWRNADLSAVAGLIESQIDEADRVYQQVAAAAPNLSVAQWEAMMAQLMVQAYGEVPAGAIVVNVPAEFAPPELIDTTGHDPVSPEALEAAATNAQRGVIIALVPPRPVAEALAALGTEAVEEIHVTLAYLGKTDDDGRLPGLDDAPINYEQLVAAVAAFCAGAGPLGEAKVQGLGRFDIGNDTEAVWAAVDCVGLGDLRARLVVAVEAAGAVVARDHDFTAHLTIAYAPAGEGPTQMPDTSLSWQPRGLAVWWGDQRVELPLGHTV